jgi:hypothetical protein
MVRILKYKFGGNEGILSIAATHQPTSWEDSAFSSSVAIHPQSRVVTDIILSNLNIVMGE